MSADLTLQEVFAIEIADALPGVESGSQALNGQALPYIQFGNSTSGDDYPLGPELHIEVHVWSNAEGPHEVKTLQAAIRAVLHDRQVTRGDWLFTCLREREARVIPDVKPEVWHGVQRFRALASPVL